MEQPIAIEVTMEDARAYFNTIDPVDRQQFATMIGGYLFSTAPSDMSVEAVLQMIGAVLVLLAGNIVQVILTDDKLSFNFGQGEEF
jgi:uncharacterized protein YdeI (BOF family)